MSYFEDIAETIKEVVNAAAPQEPEQPSTSEQPAAQSSSSSSSGTSASSLAVDPSNAMAMAEIYKVLAPMSTDYANAQAEQIGQAQRSMGTLAGRTMGNSQTAGLGNYTYNRLIRPQVDTMRDELLVKGYTAQLNKLLSDSLSSAKSNYRKKSSGSGSGGSSSGTTDDPDNQGTSGVTKIEGVEDKSTGSGKTTSWTALPASYQWQDDDGNWHTATRNPAFSDEDWLRTYNFAKNKYEPQGRFKG